MGALLCSGVSQGRVRSLQGTGAVGRDPDLSGRNLFPAPCPLLLLSLAICRADHTLHRGPPKSAGTLALLVTTGTTNLCWLLTALGGALLGGKLPNTATKSWESAESVPIERSGFSLHSTSYHLVGSGALGREGGLGNILLLCGRGLGWRRRWPLAQGVPLAPAVPRPILRLASGPAPPLAAKLGHKSSQK